MIYLRLEGRLGNQLFIYATARVIQKLKGDKDTIYIEDVGNQAYEGFPFDDLLEEYDLPNVVHVHDLSLWKSLKWLPMRLKWSFINHFIETSEDFDEKHDIEVRNQALFNRLGFFHIRDGYVPYPKKFRNTIYVNGYFQSPKYFDCIRDELLETFTIKDQVEKSNYPNLEKIQSRNTVCISAKIMANVGNDLYDVCNHGYYQRAIDYICEKVENPLFFICSDVVDYVVENLIDTSKYDYVCQDPNAPIPITLGVMAQCKHFIISNSSFSWWAQYLSDNEDKIVVAPDHWYNGVGDWQFDIFQDNWVKL